MNIIHNSKTNISLKIEIVHYHKNAVVKENHLPKRRDTHHGKVGYQENDSNVG